MASRKQRKSKKSTAGPVVVGFLALCAVGSAMGYTKASGATSGANAGVKTQTNTLSKHMKDIRFCESTDNYKAVNKKSPSHTGAFQFADSTWAAYKTGYTHAKDAPASVQDKIAIKEHAKNGDAPWLDSKPCWSKR